MNPLYQHIEHLLLSHDCVIVPHFGGFVAQDAAARYVEAEALFFPPVRLVRFNPDLTIGDDLLLSHICSFYGYEKSEGKRAIQTMVHQLRGQLLADGIVDFGSLGIFSQNDDGDIEFSACQAGATTPALYGLDAFSMPRLSHRSASHNAKRRALPQPTDERPLITINISRRTIRRALTAAAVILAVVLFAVPIDMLRRHHTQMASLFPSKLPTKTLTIDTPASQDQITEATAVTEETPQCQADNAVLATEPEQQVQPAAQVENNYAIVFACNISKKNAERYCEELAAKGIAGARVVDNGHTIRVLVDGIATETEAYNQAREFHAMGGDLADAWVLKL